jgi:hypothetical protein
VKTRRTLESGSPPSETSSNRNVNDGCGNAIRINDEEYSLHVSTNIISELRTFADSFADHLGPLKALAPRMGNHGSCLSVSLDFTLLLILLLPEGKFLNIIPAVAGMSAATLIRLG